MGQEKMETVTLEPHWENTAHWFAQGLSEHAFEKCACEPVLSFVEQIAYLAATDPVALERVKDRLRAKAAGGFRG
jgi:hypothetical protein